MPTLGDFTYGDEPIACSTASTRRWRFIGRALQAAVGDAGRNCDLKEPLRSKGKTPLVVANPDFDLVLGESRNHLALPSLEQRSRKRKDLFLLNAASGAVLRLIVGLGPTTRYQKRR